MPAITCTGKESEMATAIIGAGNIGGAVARHLANGGEPVVLAAKDQSKAEALANELGPLARASSVEDAIAAGDAVVFALWLDALQEVLPRQADGLQGKVVIDPSNPVGFDANGQPIRTIPEGQSQASIVASLLPAGAHYVKAFGTLAAPSLASSSNRDPRAVLFYATDDDEAAATAERLIRAAGFDPLKAGGLADAGRIEMPGGDLHQAGLNGAVLDLEEAQALLAKDAVQA
jgi:8-hydroxy-5-deazaflavin:NADPH oxidoreductase